MNMNAGSFLIGLPEEERKYVLESAAMLTEKLEDAFDAQWNGDGNFVKVIDEITELVATIDDSSFNRLVNTIVKHHGGEKSRQIWKRLKLYIESAKSRNVNQDNCQMAVLRISSLLGEYERTVRAKDADTQLYRLLRAG